MIDNTIVAGGGAAEAPEISVAPTGLITATAGGKTSTLQQQTGEFYYYPTGDAFHTASPAYLVAQGFFPSKEAVVVDRSQGATNITVTTRTFKNIFGVQEQQNCLVIPLSNTVHGGKSGILAFAVGYMADDGINYSVFGVINGYEYEIKSNAISVNSYDADGAYLYIAIGTKNLLANNKPLYVVVYRKA